MIELNFKQKLNAMDLSGLLNGPSGQAVINSIAGQLGMDEKQAAKAVKVAIPTILGGLEKNAQSPEGAASLNNALESKHNGSLLDNLADMLQNKPQALQQDGGGILAHVFGNDVNAVAQGVSHKTGVSSDKIGPLLTMLAPVVMGYLGKQKSQNNVNSGGLGDLIGGLLGGSGKKQKGGGGIMDIVTDFLDKDNDGSAVDDIIGMFTKKK